MVNSYMIFIDICFGWSLLLSILAYCEYNISIVICDFMKNAQCVMTVQILSEVPSEIKTQVQERIKPWLHSLLASDDRL